MSFMQQIQDVVCCCCCCCCSRTISKFVDVIPTYYHIRTSSSFLSVWGQLKKHDYWISKRQRQEAHHARPTKAMELFYFLTFYNVHVLVGFVPPKLWKRKYIETGRLARLSATGATIVFVPRIFKFLEKVVGEKRCWAGFSHIGSIQYFLMVVHHIFACEDNICNLIFATFGRPSWFLWLYQ